MLQQHRSASAEAEVRAAFPESWPLQRAAGVQREAAPDGEQLTVGRNLYVGCLAPGGPPLVKLDIPMKVFRSSEDAAGQLTRPAIAIGNFDGVHLGHRALFARAIELAQGARGIAAALTFEPHPARFFRPELAPPLITTEAQKLRLMEHAGIEAVVVQQFDRAFAALTPEQFAAEILAGRLGAHHVVVGRSFVFGRGRAGDLATLQALGDRHGFVAHGIEPVREGGIIISSTKVREFILMGRVEGAATLLGREFALEGRVVRGAGRGRTIGIPTANLEPHNELVPRRGVYAGRVQLPSGQLQPAVINIGTAPTVRTSGQLIIEAHLLDFAGQLVDQELVVYFTCHLRDEQRFSSVDALVQAIHGDIARARVLLEQR